ncbi:VirB8/TrbF family protein [Salinibacter ruber]|uniref:VirB8/TrbF family protein n=1 Tax=Salinibacter ruber TaxID=146919 RepID=UPI00216AAF55|nr:VirB8/TrbF family protein [Salinibacter ruber]
MTHSTNRSSDQDFPSQQHPHPQNGAEAPATSSTEDPSVEENQSSPPGAEQTGGGTTPAGRLLAWLGLDGFFGNGGRSGATGQGVGGETNGQPSTNGIAAPPGWTKGGNPYVRPEKEWQSRYMDLATAKRNWQLIAGASVLTCLVLVVAYVQLSMSSRVVPFPVAIDSLGIPLAYGTLEPKPDVDLAGLVERSSIASFILNTRRVVADPVAQRHAIESAYQFLDARGQAFLNSYFSRPENDPLRLGKRIRREVKVQSILKIPGSSSYRVTWTERERGISSRKVTKSTWEAILNVGRAAPTEITESAIANPLGTYILDVNWGPISASE